MALVEHLDDISMSIYFPFLFLTSGSFHDWLFCMAHNRHMEQLYDIDSM